MSASGMPLDPRQLIQMLLQQQQSQQGQQPMSEKPPGMVQPFGAQPNMTASAQQGPLQAPSPVRAGDVGKTEWDTKGGRAMAITQASIESFSNAFKTGEQKNWQKKSAQAEQAWQSYRGLQQALAEAQDPKAKEAIQKQLDAMMQDKNVQKIMKKAHQDPTSAEGVGLQRAMAQSKQEAKEQQALEEMQSKIHMQQEQAKAEQARAQQEQATANLRNVQALQEGQVTPKVVAEEQTKKDVQEAKNKETQDRMNKWAEVENKRTQVMRDVGMARVQAQLKKAKGNSDMVKYFKVQADSLNKQLDQVDKQVKDVQDNIGKTSFFRRGHLDTLNKKLPALSMRRQAIEKQLGDLQQQMQLAQQHNAVQFEPEQEQTTPGVSTPPQPDGSSPENAITVQ